MAKLNFGNMALNALSTFLEPAVAEVFGEILEKLRASDPVAHKTVVTALYGPVDVQLENLAKKSRTKIDDAVVLGIKGAVEFSADAGEITLQNLDEGQPND